MELPRISFEVSKVSDDSDDDHDGDEDLEDSDSDQDNPRLKESIIKVEDIRLH